MLQIVVAAAVLVAPRSSDTAPLQTYTLANGLRVVIEAQRTFPTIAVHVIYGVGMVDDPLSQPGLTHLVEHLACGNTQHVTHGSIMAQLGWRGATAMNAETSPDSTVYYETVPAAELDTALWLESDRMGFLAGAIGDESLRHERLIVAQEQAHHETFARDQALWRRVWKRLFPAGHPYASNYVTRVDNVTNDDVEAVVRRYYGPKNAVLVLVGDLPYNVRDRIHHYFGDLPAAAPPSRSVRQPAAPTHTIDYSSDDGSRYVAAWSIGAEHSRAYRAATIVAQILESQRWTLAQTAALNLYVFTAPFEVSSVFWLEAQSGTPVDQATLAMAVDEQLERLRDSVDEHQLAIAVKGRAVAELARRQTFEGRARLHAKDALFDGRVYPTQEARARLKDVTVAEVKHFLATLIEARAAAR